MPFGPRGMVRGIDGEQTENAMINAIAQAGALCPTPAPATQRASGACAGAWAVDRAEITGMTVTDAITALDRARVDALRRSIAAGTYLTDHKLDFVAERLADVLQAEVPAGG